MFLSLYLGMVQSLVSIVYRPTCAHIIVHNNVVHNTACSSSDNLPLPLLPAALRAAQICRYFVYSEADFEVFRPAGATRCTDGVKFGMEEGLEGTFGPLLHAKFHPHRCNDKGIGPPKLKFLLRFDRNVKYKRPAWAYPLRDFHKICRVCTSFRDALGVKIWFPVGFAQGVMELWGF